MRLAARRGKQAVSVEIRSRHEVMHAPRRTRPYAAAIFHDRRRSPRSRGAVGARRSRRLLSLRDTARAMSQENVEIVQRSMRACERARLRKLAETRPSRRRLGSVLARVWPPTRSLPGPDGGPHVGCGDLGSVWRDFRMRGRANHRTCGDRVVGSARASKPGRRTSGIDRVSRCGSASLDCREGKLVRDTHLLEPRGSPRSRGALGVGDVAGERGDRAASDRGFRTERDVDAG